jgi:hypothetical protein
MYGLSTLGSVLLPSASAMGIMRVCAVFLILGIFLIFRRQAQGYQAFVLIWLLVPIALSFLFSYLFFPVYLIKDFLIVLPAFYLVLARGIYYKNRAFSLTILAIIFLLHINPLMKMYDASINVDWQKAVRFIKGNDLKDNDIIIMATTKEIVSFMYYLSDADKAALRDILIFGKFENGRWRESFRYKGYSVITLGSERTQVKGKYHDPGFGINKIYKAGYITADFDKKVMQEDILNSNRQIWLLISMWAGDAYYSQAMSDRLKTHFEPTLAEEAGGIKIYRFRPRL